MEREFPWLQLNVQHRMHDELYAHLIACVYKSDIDSRYSTNNPSPFLQNLLAHPTQVIAGSNYYELRSFLHFIDVEHGKQESEEGASSWNTLEVNAVDALVKALIERPGIEKGDIGVLTGYRAQKKLLGSKSYAAFSNAASNAPRVFHPRLPPTRPPLVYLLRSPK